MALPPARRALPWALLLEVVVLARDHVGRLTPGERAHLVALVRKSRGRPGNLSAHERNDVRRLAGKLDLPALGRGLGPIARRARGRP
jgi:hypothetical protein